MKEPIMTYNEIQDFIPSIDDYWTRTFIATQYFCAARVGELVQHHHKRDNQEYDTQGLEYERIKELEDAWTVTIPNFKQRNINALKQGFFVKSVEPWLHDTLKDLFREKTQGNVFPFRRDQARKIIKKEIGKLGFDSYAKKTFSSHNLRDTRADHLMKIYDFNARELQRTLGLTNLNNLQHYIESNIQDRIQKMKRKQM